MRQPQVHLLDNRLERDRPFVRVRASTTKNGKAAEMRLHPELVELLRNMRPARPADEEPIFAKIPRIERFYRDLAKAGIPVRDAQGRKAVFHSLRKTFGTNLAKAGVPSRVTMTLMRHSDRRLTDHIYTDENLPGTWEAFDTLPNYAERASQIASQKSVAGGQNGALAVTGVNEPADAKTGENPRKVSV